MNIREAWAWSNVLRALVEENPHSAYEWQSLADSLDYLNERAFKAFQRSDDKDMAQCVCMMPVWSTKRIEDLLRRASVVGA